DRSVRFVKGIKDLPNGFDPRVWRFVDLDGEGLTGLLTEQGAGWFYKRNEGEGSFGVARRLPKRPNASLAEPGIQLRDVDGDGNLDVMVLRPGVAGYYSRTPDEGWETFRRFHRVPNVDPADPSIQWIDLTGDGRADLFVSGDQVYTFWPSR